MKILIIVILIFLASWTGRQGTDIVRSDKAITTAPTQMYVDTVMVFRNLRPSKATQMTRLTESIVKPNLYKYYKKRDCFIEDDYPSPLSEKDYQKNTVLYNLSHFVSLNGDKFMDAIVEYWLTPPGASGHCYQPHKAMVVSGPKGYAFINPDFVDSSFSIDSVKSANKRAFIFGCEYDCGSHTRKRNIRVAIQ